MRVEGGGNEIVNSGIITGPNAIRFVNGPGGGANSLLNTGTIQTGQAQFGGAINNTAASNAIYIENHGVIEGFINLGLGDDRFDAGTGTFGDEAFLGAGDDRVILRQADAAGMPFLAGDEGSDTLDMEHFHSAVWVALNYGGPEVWTRNATTLAVGEGAWQAIADLENFENITGSIGIDFLQGDGGDNTFGYVGAQFIHGVETISGLAGTDTADFQRFDSGVWVDLEFEGPEAWTRDDDDLMTGAWRAIADLSGIENLRGTAALDELRGDAADNVLFYEGDQDIPGVDILDGRAGSDTADFSGYNDAVWINLDFAIEVWTEDDNNAHNGSGTFRQIADLAGIENITGSNHSDLIYGDAGANVIDGGRSNDILSGGGDDDTFIFVGAHGYDTIVDFAASDGEKIDLSAVSEITDFADLDACHVTEISGDLAIFSSEFDFIILEGWTRADLGVGLALSADDFIF